MCLSGHTVYGKEYGLSRGQRIEMCFLVFARACFVWGLL